MINLLLRRRRAAEKELSFERLYLTFEALEPGSFQCSKDANYSINEGPWVALTAATDTPTLAVGDTIRWKAVNTPDSTNGVGIFSSTGQYNAYGNPLSMRVGDSFRGVTTLPTGDYTFYKMFFDSTLLVNAENLKLVATSLSTKYCYGYMFSGCINLITYPELPATTLSEGCYRGMFRYCESIISTPSLNVTTLSNYCYAEMFRGCLSLVNVTDLPATGRLTIGCYYGMFRDCASLVNAPYISATSSYGYTSEGVSSTALMFNGCTSLKNIPRMPIASSSTTHSFYYTFANCSSLETIPEITIYSNKDSCAYGMFYNCTSLKSGANITISGTSTAYCSLRSMFEGCTSLTTLPSIPSSLGVGLYGLCSMFKGCTALTTTPTINITSNSDYSFLSTFDGCTSLITNNITFTVTSAGYQCYAYMFRNTKITSASTLTATTIGSYCYTGMFYGCTDLVTAPSIAATTRSASNNRNEMYEMFRGCTSLKTPPPTLSLSTTGIYSYGYMFTGCTNLESVPTITTTQFGLYCCRFMFSSCTKITNTGSITVAIIDRNFFEGTFQSCTALTDASGIVISAETIPVAACQNMFNGCINLSIPPILSSTILNSSCYIYMFRGCTSLTTAPVLPAPTLVSSCYYLMFDGCSNLNYVKCLATNISASNCVGIWVRGVSSSGTFIKHPDISTWPRSTSGIPTNWTVVDAVIS